MKQTRRVCQRRAGEPCMSDNNGTALATTPRKFAFRNCLNREIAGWWQGTRKTAAAADAEGGWGAVKSAEQEGVLICC